MIIIKYYCCYSSLKCTQSLYRCILCYLYTWIDSQTFWACINRFLPRDSIVL